MPKKKSIQRESITPEEKAERRRKRAKSRSDEMAKKVKPFNNYINVQKEDKAKEPL